MNINLNLIFILVKYSHSIILILFIFLLTKANIIFKEISTNVVFTITEVKIAKIIPNAPENNT